MGGEYLIFSTYGPTDPSKDMLELLRRSAEEAAQCYGGHPCLSVAVEELRACGPPFEIPDQPFPFLYRLRRQAA